MDELLAALKDRHRDRDTTRFSVTDFAYAFGSTIDAAMYGHIWWPRYVRYRDMVFLSHVVEDSDDRQRIQQSIVATNADLQGIEKSFNRMDMPESFFSTDGAEFSDALIEDLARCIADAWTAKLAFDGYGHSHSAFLKHDNQQGFYVTVSRIKPDLLI